MSTNPIAGYPFPPIKSKEPIVFRIHLKDNSTYKELDFGRDLSGIKDLRLIGYKAEFLNNTNTLLFRFTNQPMVPTYSNDDFQSYTPITFDNVNQMVWLNTPIPIMGCSQSFGCSHKVYISIKKQDGLTPVVYSKLELYFVGKNDYDQQEQYYREY